MESACRACKALTAARDRATAGRTVSLKVSLTTAAEVGTAADRGASRVNVTAATVGSTTVSAMGMTVVTATGATLREAAAIGADVAVGADVVTTTTSGVAEAAGEGNGAAAGEVNEAT